MILLPMLSGSKDDMIRRVELTEASPIWRYGRLQLLAIACSLTVGLWPPSTRAQEVAPIATPPPSEGPTTQSESSPPPSLTPELTGSPAPFPAPATTSTPAASTDAAPETDRPDEAVPETTQPAESELEQSEKTGAAAPEVDLGELQLIPNSKTAARLERQFGSQVKTINWRINQRKTELRLKLTDLTSSDREIRRLQAELSQLRTERDRLAIEHLLLMRQVTEKLVFPASFAPSESATPSNPSSESNGTRSSQ